MNLIDFEHIIETERSFSVKHFQYIHTQLPASRYYAPKASLTRFDKILKMANLVTCL